MMQKRNKNKRKDVAGVTKTVLRLTEVSEIKLQLFAVGGRAQSDRKPQPQTASANRNRIRPQAFLGVWGKTHKSKGVGKDMEGRTTSSSGLLDH